MRHAGWRSWIILVAVLAAASSAQAQRRPGGPEFANDPQDPAPPEFCPPELPTISRTPFDNPEPPPNAFVDACRNEGGSPCVFYFGIGGLGLKRQGLGNGLLAVNDTGSGQDIGGVPPADSNTAIRFGNVPAAYHWGVAGMLGVQQGNHALEFGGFFISEQNDRFSFSDPGRLDLPFGNFAAPPGFEGNKGLWLQADRVAMQLRSQISSAEVNYRHIFGPSFELISGLRFLGQRETLGITTNDDNLVNPPSNQLLEATYQTHTSNRIVGGQLGFEANQFLIPERFALGMWNKYVVGPNFMEADNRLVRGDGLFVDLGRRTQMQIGGAIEVNAFATIWFNSHVRLRGGYQALWLFNVIQAHDQIDFNPNQALPGIHRTDSIFYHGPRIELEIGF